MSAIGPKQISLVAPHMCAFGGKADIAIVLLLLAGFPSRRILNRHATRNAAVLAMNDSRHGTAQPGLIFGMELREFFFADVFNVLFHVFWVLGLLEFGSR
jgi:hypothetical protein